MDGISVEIECQGRPDRITTRILQEWVGGRGVVPIWYKLVKTLRDCELNTLADHMHAGHQTVSRCMSNISLVVFCNLYDNKFEYKSINKIFY